MELVLVRHALPVRIDATPDGAPADPGLAERGYAQAERVVAALALDGVDADGQGVADEDELHAGRR